MGENSGVTNAAVTFDLWQTLVFEDGGSTVSHPRRANRTKYVVRELNRLGESVETEVVRDAFGVLSNEITAGHDDGFDQNYDQWVSVLIERLAPGLEQRVGAEEIAGIGRLIDRTFIESPPQLVEGTGDLLAELAGRGLKIGLISNTGLTSPTMFGEWFDEHGLLGYFDFLAFSNELAISKPHRSIFDTTLNELGVEPQRALHVGDNLHTDVGGAAAAGMSTVWVRGGTSSPVEVNVEPEYAVDSIIELPAILDQWLPTLNG